MPPLFQHSKHTVIDRSGYSKPHPLLLLAYKKCKYVHNHECKCVSNLACNEGNGAKAIEALFEWVIKVVFQFIFGKPMANTGYRKTGVFYTQLLSCTLYKCS